ncbi:MAG: HAD family hydrolase [Candidatus Methylomirabilales bacterium]|nr:HAD family hydrolase [candidate division NC10 bacterium]MCZ6550248.1 HAD family hydrolase [candidate division NC10 bacterium]
MDGGRAFLLDFDHTLFDTDRFFWVDVPAAFARFAIDPQVWEESYARVWPTGYSLEKHLEHLARGKAVGSSDVAAIQRVLREHFADLRGYLFADVEPFLKQLQEEKIPCFLLSFGDPAWQAYKVNGARIADFFQEVFTTRRERAKAEVVEALAKRFARLAVVDNDPRELDVIKARRPQVETFWITRVPPEALKSSDPEIQKRFREARNYATLPAEFPHHRCQSLEEVSL